MSPRILIVEDHPINMELLVYLLEASGYSVGTAANGNEGLKAAAHTPPSLILCDLQMPILDGFGFLKALREIPALTHIPVIAVTASSMPNDRERVHRAGFDGYLTKPITPESFVTQIEAWLPPEQRRSIGSQP